MQENVAILFGLGLTLTLASAYLIWKKRSDISFLVYAGKSFVKSKFSASRVKPNLEDFSAPSIRVKENKAKENTLDVVDTKPSATIRFKPRVLNIINPSD